jgi:Zn-finger nucleic acid-binding protein
MNAQTFRCESCGAAVSSESPVCEHCGARLAVIACPSCFGMMFRETKFCPHCGAPAVEWQRGEVALACPACGGELLQGGVGPHLLWECGKCFGLWLDNTTFEQVCRAAEQQAAALPEAHLGQPYVKNLGPVRYRRCPVCQELMNRVNFARCSGVVVDVCGQHGTWFDRNELQQIVEFVRAGGLDRARERQKSELVDEARRLEALRREPVPGGSWPYEARSRRDLLTLVMGAANGLRDLWPGKF